MATEPSACIPCLRRARLLGILAPHIERISTREPGSRAPELLRLSDADLAAAAARDRAGAILEAISAISEDELLSGPSDSGCWAVCEHDPAFPAGLADAADAPRALFGRGDHEHLGRLDPAATVTVVGARRATTYGRGVARELGADLARAGLVVVSGLAFGIDGCVHRGALEGGLTVAVLGCGADIAYPAAHRSLWRRVADRGMVLSEMPPGTGAWRWCFPARNRIMAGLATMTVVVEAAVRSGSLITVDIAADLGRDLGAVPGPVGSRLSAGPNGLLAGGACVIRDAQDVLDAMLGPGRERVEVIGPALGEEERRALEAVELGSQTCDAVAAELAIGGADAATALGGLEAHGYISCDILGVYARTSLVAPSPDDE